MGFLNLAIFIAVLTRISALNLLSEVSLELGDTPYVFTSYNFPNDAPGNLNQEWKFTASQGSVVRVVCPDIRIRQRSDIGCGNEKITFSTGDDTREVCGFKSSFTIPLSSSAMTVTYATGRFAYGAFKCEAQAVQASRTRREVIHLEGVLYPIAPNIGVPSEEVDSSEHGGYPGPRATSCNCGWANKDQKRIVNGRETDRQEYPFMVNLVKTDDKTPFCGGTIITRAHILTAAHCTIKAPSPAHVSIVVRKHDTWSANHEDTYQALSIHNHESYDTKTHKHDISIIYLERDIEFNQYVGPVCLTPNRPNIDRQYVKVIGWGRTSTEGNPPPALQEINIRVVPIDLCQSALQQVDSYNPTQMCTFSTTKSVCFGDSGGPVLWVDPETNRYTQVGLMSYIAYYCADDYPAVHTDVTFYYNWIQRTISDTYPANICRKV